MAVQFVIGRAGSGKTHRCLEAIAGALRAGGDDRLILLVPEQASLQMERALAAAAPGGCFTRAAVVSFSRLAQRVWDELGYEPPLLTAEARTLALRALVTQQRDTLRYFRAAAHTPGFFTHLQRVIEELLVEGTRPEALHAAAETLTDARLRVKTSEIAHLLAAYLDWLGPHRVDPALRLRLLRDQLRQLPWLPGARVWVDGFAGFTGEEMATLVALAQRARQVTLTLLADRVPAAGPLPATTLFRRPCETYRLLADRFTEAAVERVPDEVLPATALPRFATSPDLVAVERSFVEPERTPVLDPASAPVRLVACNDQADEIRAAARFIRRQVQSGAARYRDFALIARDLAPVAELVPAICAEYALPYFLDRRQALRTHPLCQLVRCLFEVAESGAGWSAMRRLLQLELLPLSRDEREGLAAVLARHEITGWAAWRREDWSALRGGFLLPAAGAAPRDELREARYRLLAGLEPVLSVAGTAPAPQWAAQLYASLVELGVPATLESWIAAAETASAWDVAEYHRLAWQALCDLLDEFCAVLGDTALAGHEVSDIVAATFRDTTIGLAPPTLDQVLVSGIERSRHPEIRHAWVIGLNEGVFPAPPTEHALFTERERRTLAAAGVPAPRPQEAEAFDEELLAYIAFTRPSESLTLSWSAVDARGDALPPSPFVTQLATRLGLEGQPAATEEPPLTLGEAADALLAARADLTGSARLARLRRRLLAAPAVAPRLERMLRGEHYRNAPKPVGQYRPAPAGGDDAWAPAHSELDVALQCPFRHFVRYGLQVGDELGPTPLAWELGSLAHDVLAAVTRRATASGHAPADIDDATWMSYLDEALRPHENAPPPGNPGRAAERRFILTRVRARVTDLVRVHAERWRRGDTMPQVVEHALAGPGIEPARVPLPAGDAVALRGIIDRIDSVTIDGRQHFFIYDYKPQSVRFTTSYLTGARLQVVLYAYAWAQQTQQACAGILVAPLQPDEKVLESRSARQADPLTQLMLMYRPRGLIRARAAAALDHNLSTSASPVANLRLKKDGDFDARCDARDDDAFAAHLALATTTVETAAQRVLAGRVEVQPLVDQRTLACRFCPYRPICRFDRAYNQPVLAESVLPVLDAEADA